MHPVTGPYFLIFSSSRSLKVALTGSPGSGFRRLPGNSLDCDKQWRGDGVLFFGGFGSSTRGEKKSNDNKKKNNKNNTNVNVQSSLKHLVSDAEPSKAVHPRPVTQPTAAPHTHTLHICILI